jgi:hypothetical protein
MLVAHLVKAHRRVIRQPCGHRAIGAIQFVGQRCQCRPGHGRQAQCATNDRARGFPFSALEQTGAGIGVTPAGGYEHVAPTLIDTQFGKYAESVGMEVDGVVFT